MNVLLIGHYGKGNLGDDAMLAGIRQALSGRHELHVISPQKIEGVRTSPQKPLDLLKAGSWADWILMGGGTIIHDETHNPRFKHRGLMQAVVVFALARLTGCSLAYIGMGLGPLRHSWKRRVVELLFEGADHVSLRDTMSIGEWRRCTSYLQEKAWRTFDSSVALVTSDRSDSATPCSTETSSAPLPRVIGLNLLPYFQIYEDDLEGDRRLLDLVIGALRTSLSKGSQIRLFTFNKKNEESEEAFIEEARQRLNGVVETEVIPYLSPSRTLEEIGKCDAMIAMRYHGSMLAYLAGIPQVVLSYHPKCTALARDIGCSSSGVIDIRRLYNPQHLVDAVREMQNTPSAFCASLPVEEAREQFESFYFPPPLTQ